MTDTEILDYLESQLRVPMPTFDVLVSTGGVPPQVFLGWSISRSDTAYPTLREAVMAMRDQARPTRND